MKQLSLFITSIFCLQLAFAQNAPVAVNDTFIVSANVASSLPVLANDYDVDGDPLSISIVNNPQHGSVTVNGNTVTYIPNANYMGVDSFTYAICDPMPLCDTATVYLNVQGGNNYPVAINDTFTINKNQSATLPVLSNDFDPDGDPLTVTILAGPYKGALSNSGGVLTYTPDNNFVGTDSFTYIICDNGGLCDTALVIIDVLYANSPPLAQNDTFEVPINQQIIIPVLSNDADPEGDPLSISISSGPSHGTVTIVNGNQVQYTPDQNYLGMDTFVYIICDTANQCDSAYVFITVTGNSQGPVAVNDAYHFNYDDNNSGEVLDVLVNDYDSLAVPFWIVSVSDANNTTGNFTLNFDSIAQQIRLSTAFTNACGVDSFYYVICNAAQLCDTGTIVVEITCPDALPGITGFSPNGDGVNDALVFEGIENFSPVAIVVFNRYGDAVYKSDDYKNDWKGDYKEKTLPDGTYFYTLEYKGKKQSNYLLLKR